MPVFHLDDETALIRLIDAHEAAMKMARSLGIIGEVRTMVGKFREDGQHIGWTKRGKTDLEEDILVEVFISKASDEYREFDRYAREMQALLDENDALRRQLAEARTQAANA